MSAAVDRRILEGLGANHMTRRSLLGSLSAFSAMSILPGGAIAQPAGARIQTVALNHVGLICSDLKRSVAFYQRLFGMPIQVQSPNVTCLRIGNGPQFLALREAKDVKPRISHFCMSVKNFDADRMLKILKDSGVSSAKVSMGMPSDGGGGPTAPHGTPELLFTDPDGLTVQLQHTAYAGGGGLRGDVVSGVSAVATEPPLSVSTYNHCTILVGDIQRTVDFYQKHFGMFLQVKNTLVNAPDLGIGPDGPLPAHTCLGITHRPDTKPEINHVCLGMKKFDPEKVLKTLNEQGLKSGNGVHGPMTARLTYLRSLKDGGPALGGPAGGTPEIFFSDPDGITIQLQDVSFCGEANADQNGVCPN